MIGIVQVGRQQMADRYTYFPLLGIFLALVWLAADLVRGGVRVRCVLAGFAVTVLMPVPLPRSCKRATGTIASPSSATRMNVTSRIRWLPGALGSRLVEAGQIEEGLALSESAVRLAPKDAEAHFNLAVGLEKSGQTDAAAGQYETALTLDDWDPRAHTNLARILWKRNQLQEARQHFLSRSRSTGTT